MTNKTRLVLRSGRTDSETLHILTTDIQLKLKQLKTTLPWINNVKASVYLEIDHESLCTDGEIGDQIAGEIGLKSELAICPSSRYDSGVLCEQTELRKVMETSKKESLVLSGVKPKAEFVNHMPEQEPCQIPFDISMNKNANTEFKKSYSGTNTSNSNTFPQNFTEKSKSGKEFSKENPNENLKSGAKATNSYQKQLSGNRIENHNAGKENRLVVSKPFQKTNSKDISGNDMNYCDNNELGRRATLKTVGILKEPVAHKKLDDCSSIRAQSLNLNSIRERTNQNSMVDTKLNDVNRKRAQENFYKKRIEGGGDVRIDLQTDEENAYRSGIESGKDPTNVPRAGTKTLELTDQNHCFALSLNANNKASHANQSPDKQVNQKFIQGDAPSPGTNSNNPKENVNTSRRNDTMIVKNVEVPLENNGGQTDRAYAKIRTDKDNHTDRVNRVSINNLPPQLNQDTNRLAVSKINNGKVDGKAPYPGMNNNKNKKDAMIPKDCVEQLENNGGQTDRAYAKIRTDKDNHTDRVNRVSMPNVSNQLNQDTYRLTVTRIPNANTRNSESGAKTFINSYKDQFSGDLVQIHDAGKANCLVVSKPGKVNSNELQQNNTTNSHRSKTDKESAKENLDKNVRSGAKTTFSNIRQFYGNLVQNDTVNENRLDVSKPIQKSNTKDLSGDDINYCYDTKSRRRDPLKTVGALKEPVANQKPDLSSFSVNSLNQMEERTKQKHMVDAKPNKSNLKAIQGNLYDAGDLRMYLQADEDSVYRKDTEFEGQNPTKMSIAGTKTLKATEKVEHKFIQGKAPSTGMNNNKNKEDFYKSRKKDAMIPKDCVEPLENNGGHTDTADTKTRTDTENHTDRENRVSIHNVSTQLNQDTNRLAVSKINNGKVEGVQQTSIENSVKTSASFGNFKHSLTSERLKSNTMGGEAYRISSEDIPYNRKMTEERSAVYHNSNKDIRDSSCFHSKSTEYLENTNHSNINPNCFCASGSVCLFDYDADASSDGFSNMSAISMATGQTKTVSIIPNKQTDIGKYLEESDDSSSTPELHKTKRLRKDGLLEGGKKPKLKRNDNCSKNLVNIQCMGSDRKVLSWREQHFQSTTDKFVDGDKLFEDSNPYYVSEDFQKREPLGLPDDRSKKSSTDEKSHFSSSETRSEYDFKETHYLSHNSDSGCSNSGDSWVAKPLPILLSHCIGTPENAVSVEDISVNIDEVDNGNMVDDAPKEDGGAHGASVKNKANPRKAVEVDTCKVKYIDKLGKKNNTSKNTASCRVGDMADFNIYTKALYVPNPKTHSDKIIETDDHVKQGTASMIQCNSKYRQPNGEDKVVAKTTLKKSRGSDDFRPKEIGNKGHTCGSNETDEISTCITNGSRKRSLTTEYEQLPIEKRQAATNKYNGILTKERQLPEKNTRPTAVNARQSTKMDTIDRSNMKAKSLDGRCDEVLANKLDYSENNPLDKSKKKTRLLDNQDMLKWKTLSLDDQVERLLAIEVSDDELGEDRTHDMLKWKTLSLDEQVERLLAIEVSDDELGKDRTKDTLKCSK